MNHHLRFGPVVLDVNATQAERDRAIDQVRENANAAWAKAAREVAIGIAKRQEFFTTDDIWARIDRTRESRALGAVMVDMKRDGLIEPTDRFEKTKQVSRHGAPIRVWRSRIVGMP